MKELVGLIIFLGFAGLGIYWLVKKEPKWIGTGILTFAIVSGVAAANYDAVTKIKGGGIELEMAKEEIQFEKNEALERIKEEAKAQKESIELLTANTNDARERLNDQKSHIKELLGKMEKQSGYLQMLNAQAEQTKEEIEGLNNLSRDLVLTYAKIVWLQVVTKKQFGTTMDQKAKKEIGNEIDRLLPLVFPVPAEKAEWIRGLNQILLED